MTDPWTTTVKCQGPGCAKEVKVQQPGIVRPGWLILTKQSTPLANQQPKVEHFPFCSLTCLYNWTAARLPSKKGVSDDQDE